MQKHVIVLPIADGGVELHPLKQWLRDHPDQIPAGLDATMSTSHQLRGGLKRRGWKMEETESEVRLFPPGTPMLSTALSEEEAPQIEPGNNPVFGLEHQLRDFLADNLQQLGVARKKLQVYVDAAGRDGVEYPTAVGPIDILAVDNTGSFYVFELKRAESSDRAIGQIARYMGWVGQTIGKDKAVFGVIVSQKVGGNLRYARMAVPNVFLFEYKLSFSLSEAHDLNT